MQELFRLTSSNTHVLDTTTVKSITIRAQESMSISVLNIDCLDATLGLIEEGYKPVMLNMANPHHPGGSYTRGASAQEEDIFRRSDASKVLDVPETIRKYYPIDKGETLYIPTLQVFRHGAIKDYEFFASGPKKISMLCSAAGARFQLIVFYSTFTCLLKHVITVRDPIKDESGQKFANQSDRDFCRRAIHTQLDTALSHSHDAVVLGAWGCGGFGCPAEEISEIYLDILTNFFNGCFKKVLFAIVSSYANENQKDSNFHTFTNTVRKYQQML